MTRRTALASLVTLPAYARQVGAFGASLPGPHGPQVPLVSFEFDDGSADHYTAAFPALVSRGVKGCELPITDLVGTGGYATWAQLREMQTAGWEIINHQKTNTRLDILTEAQIRAEWTDSQAALIANGLSAPTNTTYMGHFYNALVLSLAPAYFRTARGQGFAINNEYSLDTYKLYCVSTVGLALAALTEYIRQIQTRNGWVIFYTHGYEAVTGDVIDYVLGLGIRVVTRQEALNIIGAP